MSVKNLVSAFGPRNYCSPLFSNSLSFLITLGITSQELTMSLLYFFTSDKGNVMTPHLALLSTFCLSLRCNEKCTKCSFTFTNEEVPQLSRFRCPCHRNEVELEWQQLPAFRKTTTGSKGKLCAFCTLLNLLPEAMPEI